MALRFNLTSPSKKDTGMQTPVRNCTSLDGTNVMDSLRRRIASTALKPKAVGVIQHKTVCLDDTDVSDITCDEPDNAKQKISASQVTSAIPRPPRPSSIWLQEVISDAEMVQEQLRVANKTITAASERFSEDSDLSSLGILTPSVMLDAFETTNDGLSESYKALMKYRQNQDCNPPRSSGSTDTANNSDNDETAEQSDESTLVGSDKSAQGFSVSELDKGSLDISTTLPQPDYGFDSKDFISADSSEIKKRLEDGETSVANAAKHDPIPSPMRVDLNEFSGFIGDGEMDIRSSWISPEKRKIVNPRLTIGEYFSLKSYNVKDLENCLYPKMETTKLHTIPAYPPSSQNTTVTLSDTIDLTDENSDSTINLIESLEADCLRGNMKKDLLNSTESVAHILDLTMVPGRDSIMSLTSIANLLNSTKGSDTVVGHLLEAAQQHKPSSKTSASNSSSTENVPPSHSNSRDTFVIHTTQGTDNQASFPRPLTPLKTDTGMNSSPSRIPILSRHKHTAPLKYPKCTPTKKHSQMSPYARQPNSTVKSLTHSTANLKLAQSPGNKETSVSNNVDIKTPLVIKGNLNGIVGFPMMLSVPVKNCSTNSLSCFLVCKSQSKHLELIVGQSISINSGSTGNLNFEVTGLVSGEHVIKLEVQITDHTGQMHIYPVADAKLSIEAPKITLENQYKEFIDFGLRPEDSRKVEIITVKNQGLRTVPLRISIEQDIQNPCFFLLVPPEEGEGEEIRLAGSMAFLLPGSDQSVDLPVQDIGLIFIPPTVDSLSGNKADKVMLEGHMKITLKLHGDGSDERVLYKCALRGEVGKTLLLVSHTDLDLYPGKPRELKIRNGGVVPLQLTFQASSMPDSTGNTTPEIAICIKPDNTLLLPNDVASLTLTFTPNLNHTSTEHRELHLTYDGLQTGNIVSLICHANEDESVILDQLPTIHHLPLKTTRQQLSWGCIRPGQTSKQTVSFKNCHDQKLTITVSIQNKDGSEDTPFKLLSEEEEVTRKISIKLLPDRDCRITVVFCPVRPGPAVAYLTISTNEQQYVSKKVLLNGYGGHSSLVLRNVSVAQGRSWIVLKPGLGDFVDGSFNLVNNGNITVCVLIKSMSHTNDSCHPIVKPDTASVPARSTQVVSVRLPEVSSILSKTDSGEVVTLCTLKILMINIISHCRLRKVLSKLSNSERMVLLRSEEYKLVNNIVFAPTETPGFPNKELDVFHDSSFNTAISLSKDMVTRELELRALGTGNNSVINIEGETTSPFFSFLDTTQAVVENQPNNSEAKTGTHVSESIALSDVGKEWSVCPKELLLQPANNYCSVIHVCNLSAGQRLCLDVQAKDELTVSPVVTEVRPCLTATIEVRLKKAPSHYANWPDAVKIYTANDVESVSVKVIPLNVGRTALMNKTLGLRSCYAGNDLTSRGWLTPSKLMASPALTYSLPLSSSIGSNNDTKKTVLSSSNSSVDETFVPKSKGGVYLDTDSICFPWTKTNTSSSVKITLYNETIFDKMVKLSKVSPPFIVEPQCVMVPSKWHKSITITFKPTVVNVFSGQLELTVENQLQSINAQLQGHSVL